MKKKNRTRIDARKDALKEMLWGLLALSLVLWLLIVLTNGN